MDWTAANAVADAIKAELLEGDKAIMVEIGAHAPTVDCNVPSIIAVIKGQVGAEDQRFSGNAIGLHSAVLIARGKLRAARLALDEARKEKRKVAREVMA